MYAAVPRPSLSLMFHAPPISSESSHMSQVSYLSWFSHSDGSHTCIALSINLSPMKLSTSHIVPHIGQEYTSSFLFSATICAHSWGKALKLRSTKSSTASPFDIIFID